MDIGDVFRKATRPIVTVIFAAVLAQVVVENITAPEWFIGLATGVILWWFGQRTVERLRTLGEETTRQITEIITKVLEDKNVESSKDIP